MQNVEIRVRGQLDKNWSEWLEHMTITHTDNGTVLAGPVRDQAALIGLLSRLAELGLPIVSVNSPATHLDKSPRDITT